MRILEYYNRPEHRTNRPHYRLWKDLILILLFGLLVQLLWNAMIPNLFGLSRIAYWQSVGLIVLGKLIFTPFVHSAWVHRHRQTLAKEAKN